MKSEVLSEFPSSSPLKWAMAVLYLYFGLRLVYLALTISPAIPPDEMSHFGICTIFSGVFFLPENSPASYPYGLVTNIPWLYYWLMGKLLLLNVFGMPDLVWLRLLNIPLAFATVFFVCRTLRLLTDDRLTLILLLVAMTNTMMFTFISAFVSYDNLANLLAAMSVYYLLAFFRDRSGSLLLLSWACQVAGCLTKSTFLPLALILLLLLFVHEFRNLSSLPAAMRDVVARGRWRGAGLLLAVLAGVVLNVQLYAGNYRHYGKLKLEMYDVLPFDSVMQNPLAARNMILSLYQEGRVSSEQAVAMASRISHPGERLDAITSVRNYEKFRYGGAPPMSVSRYAVFWVKRMAAGIFGVQGRLTITAGWPASAPLICLGLLGLAAFVICWRPKDAAGLPTCLAIIAGGYALILLYGVNYQSYLENGSVSLALQGRYLFPVIGTVYLLASYYLMQLFSGSNLRFGIFVLAVTVFISYDFPLFLSRVNTLWYIWPKGGALG
jgi:hypothetical protein